MLSNDVCSCPHYIHHSHDNNLPSLFTTRDSRTQHIQPRFHIQVHNRHQSTCSAWYPVWGIPRKLYVTIKMPWEWALKWSKGQKVITTTRSIFWKEEQDKSTKCRGSCVSALIMIVCAITASARLIWENVFSLQIDRRRDGENPFDPAKIRSASQTCAVDKNVSFPQTSAEQCQQQSSWAVVHRQVQVMIATEHNTIYNA